MTSRVVMEAVRDSWSVEGGFKWEWDNVDLVEVHRAYIEVWPRLLKVARILTEDVSVIFQGSYAFATFFPEPLPLSRSL